MTDNDIHTALDNFTKAHKKAALRYCKKNAIDIKTIHCEIDEKQNVFYYNNYSNEKLLMVAQMKEVVKVEMKFKN